MTDLLSVAQAADRLAISTTSVRQIPIAELPRYRVGPRGGRIRFRAADVEHYLQSRLERPAGPVRVASVVRGRLDGLPAQHV